MDDPQPMPNRRTPGYEMAILRSLDGATRFRERYEERKKPGDPPMDDTAVTFNGLANFLHMQGLLIAHLALEPETSSELVASAVRAADQVPAWMDLRVFGASEAPERLFALGCAQLLAEQRAALERIIDEQVEDPERIEESLAESPIPTGSQGESAEEIFICFGLAFQANFQATLAIARDLDEWLEEEMEREEEDEEEEEDEDEEWE
jgi:hypothetical protein